MQIVNIKNNLCDPFLETRFSMQYAEVICLCIGVTQECHMGGCSCTLILLVNFPWAAWCPLCGQDVGVAKPLVWSVMVLLVFLLKRWACRVGGLFRDLKREGDQKII